MAIKTFFFIYYGYSFYKNNNNNELKIVNELNANLFTIILFEIHKNYMKLAINKKAIKNTTLKRQIESELAFFLHHTSKNKENIIPEHIKKNFKYVFNKVTKYG